MNDLTRLFVTLALLALAGVAVAQPADRTIFGLAVTVAQTDDGAVVDEDWITTQVRNANTIFAPHGVGFVLADRYTMGSEHARLENRVDRHVLGHLQHDERIDWFVVQSLRDVDDRSRYRQGVHWRPRGDQYPARAHFVITSRIAGETVLAHELGHIFGNGHSDVPGNIMSYERGDVPPFFDATQGQRIRFEARRFLRRGELVEMETAGSE